MKTIQIKESKIYFGDLPSITSEGSVLLISDENIAPLYLQSVINKICSPEIFTLILPSGEESKSFVMLQKILDFALECKLDRQSTMIALGGGVVSDLVGLASGLFMRSIPFYNIPTTLLAQVDASVGGKCGINTPYGKNLIGLFHQPKQVFISPYFLKTLPPREWSAGMAEVIKIAICFDQNLFTKLFDTEWTKTHLLEVIFQSVALKAQVVEQDEKERGLRSALNYGHTFGHAIEKEQNYRNLLHGEAVSIGMVMANSLARDITNFQESQAVIDLLTLYHLPTSYRIAHVDLFYQSLFLDKKAQNKQIRFILPKQIGSFGFYTPQKDQILEVLSEFV